jgi:hypothetical protein
MIAKNGNFYKIVNIPSDFWDNWKADKAGMKEKGYSPFKFDGKWYLAIYSKTKASSEEILAFNKKQAEKWISEIEINVNDQLDETLDMCQTVDDVIRTIYKYEHLFNNASGMIEYIEKCVFYNNLSKE